MMILMNMNMIFESFLYYKYQKNNVKIIFKNNNKNANQNYKQ